MHPPTKRDREGMRSVPAPRVAAFLALALGASAAFGGAARADDSAEASATQRERAVTMQRYMVSSTRIARNPWLHGSLPGLEILSRASGDETDWVLDALQRGLAIQDAILPGDWLPRSPIPCTVIVDDADLNAIPVSQIHTQPVEFHPPADELTWGDMSQRPTISNEPVASQDGDTYAFNSNLHGVDTTIPAYASASLERLLGCAPPLPRWVIAGLLGPDCGLFREAFLVISRLHPTDPTPPPPDGRIRRAVGPGTLWVSLNETQRLLVQLKKEKKKTEIPMLPLGSLFAEAPPPDEGFRLWESEAGLFVRWGLMGPGRQEPAMSRAFVELVRRARSEPVTEGMFTDCFGFAYAVMEARLQAYLREVLAQPTSFDLDLRLYNQPPVMAEATADQIGRILGDWLRMQAQGLRTSDPEMCGEFSRSAGRMLERAYREDNGLPPDVDPTHGDAGSDRPSLAATAGPAVAMKPLVVTATHIHDPGLLAVYGLYELGAGNDAKARELLEAAVKAGAARPMAYLALAEMRCSEAVARPMGAQGKISASQAASVLDPLKTALLHPASPEPYNLIAYTWAHCEAKPPFTEAEALRAGVALFPRDTALAYRSALLCAQRGYPGEAARLIDSGLVFATSGDIRGNLEKLRSTLATRGIPGSD